MPQWACFSVVVCSSSPTSGHEDTITCRSRRDTTTTPMLQLFGTRLFVEHELNVYDSVITSDMQWRNVASTFGGGEEEYLGAERLLAQWCELQLVVRDLHMPVQVWGTKFGLQPLYLCCSSTKTYPYGHSQSRRSSLSMVQYAFGPHIPSKPKLVLLLHPSPGN